LRVSVRVAAIGVSHWHSLFDSAYLRHLADLPGHELVGVQDPVREIAAKRSAALGGVPAFTDYADMLHKTRPDFVIALGRHRDMAAIAHHLLDEGYPFLMEKPMGVNAAEVEGVAAKAKAKGAFVAVPLIQRWGAFYARARQLRDDGQLGTLSHFYFRLNRPGSARYPGWDAAWMLDPTISAGGCLRNLGSHGLDLYLALVGESAEVTGAQVSRRALGAPVDDYASVLLRSAGGVLGTIEVGNLFPRDGTDGESKLAGSGGILVERDGVLTLQTSAGASTEPAEPAEPLAKLALREILDRWRRGVPPLVSVHDLVPVVRLIDRAYALAGGT
jgi:predicted dehydrogenase